MLILGIGGILGDAACAILRDGELVATIEESKLTRRGDLTAASDDLPEHSLAACLSLAGARPERLDCVAIARPISAGPEAERHLRLRARFPSSRIVLVEHHTAHAA